MINYLQNYQYVMEYDTEAKIDPKIISDVLKEAVLTTPSKQNMMPYNVHVIGPEDTIVRNVLKEKCRDKEDCVNDDKVKEYRSRRSYQTSNIQTAPYIFMFTQRVETEPSPFYKNLMSKGWKFEQTNPKRPSKAERTSMIEIGMFAFNISNLFLQAGLDVSYTRCFEAKLEYWSEPEFNFLDMPVALIMTVGKAKTYRRQRYPYLTFDIDHKPSWNRVVNFVGLNNVNTE